MKVYVITRGIYSDYTIMGVTLDKDKAEKMKTAFSDGMYGATIEEYETDEYNWVEKPLWYVCFYKDVAPVAIRDIYGVGGHPYPFVKKVHYKNSTQTHTVYVQAQDEAHALKIAEDELAMYKAREAGIV